MQIYIFILVFCISSSVTTPVRKQTTETQPSPEFKGPSIVHPHPGVQVEKRFAPKDGSKIRGITFPIIRMVNGHVSPETLEQLERLKQSHSSAEDSFDEGRTEDKLIHGELAYLHLIRDLAKEDEDLIEKDTKEAQTFMESIGKSVEDAEEAANRMTGNQRKRYLLASDDLRWEKCIIPYQWSEGFAGQQYVANAMETIQNFTGFRFVEYNEAVPDLYGLSHRNRLNFIDDDSGCWSYIGNIGGEGQNISCCSGSTCVHELGHAIGFMHEQTSPMRNDHIRVEFDGINPRFWSQYFRATKEESLTFGYYDMTSVMHYQTWGFSINYKDTMTSLDPDLLDLISKDLDYFYFFSEIEKSHNCLDQFCPGNKPVCENEGFASVVHGQCICICPDGLDPNTGCTTLASNSCGGMFELSNSDPYYELLTPAGADPNAYPDNEECVYFFKSPEGTTMQLDFIEFDVDCSDYVEIKNNLPGQSGTRFCGDGFESTIDSNFNYLIFTFHSDAEFTGRGFHAAVQLISDEENCYNRRGKDYSYAGKVNYTRSQKPCLKWNEVPNCRFNRFSNSEIDDDLDNNYCRNAGVGTAPWCYTNAETCAREYCDACGNNKCYDVFDDCAELIENDEQFCEVNLDGQAHRGCRKSCNKCALPMRKGSNITCPEPQPIEYALGPFPLSTVYRLGDQVEFKCFFNNDTRNRTCTSDGTWTELGFVCGACPRGWAHIDGKCFLWVDEVLKHDDAVKRCNDLKSGSTLAMPKTLEQTILMQKILAFDIEEVRFTWIGLNKVDDTYTWADGTLLNWTNWRDEPSGKDCVFIHQDGQWVATNCRNERSVVCEYRPGPRLQCVDQISNCDDLIQATPTLCVNQTEFAWANCPLSCGLCSKQGQTERMRELHRLARQNVCEGTDCKESSTSPTTGSVTPPTSSASTASVSTASSATSSTSPTTGSVTPPTSSATTGSLSTVSRATGSTSPTTGSVTPPTSSATTGSLSTASRATGSTSPTTGSATPPTSSASTGSVSTASRATGSSSPTTGSATPPTSSASTGSVSTVSRATGSTSPTTGSVTPPTSSASTGSVSTASRATGSTSPTTGSATPPTSSTSIGSVSTASRATGSRSPTTGSVTPPTSSASTGSVSTVSRATGSTSPTTGSVTPPTSSASTGSVSTASRATGSTSPTTGSATPPTSSASTGSVSTASMPTGSTSPTTGSATPPTSSASTGSVSTASIATDSTSPTTGSATPPTSSTSTGSVSTASRATGSRSSTTGSVTPPTSSPSIASVSTASRATGSLSTGSRATGSTSPTTGSVTPPTSSARTVSVSTASRHTGSTSPTTGSITPRTSSVSTGSASTASRETSFTSPTTSSAAPPTSSVSTGSVSTASRTTDSTSHTTGSVTPPTSSVSTGSMSPISRATGSTSPTTGSITPPTSSIATASMSTASKDTGSTSPTTSSVTPPTTSASTGSGSTASRETGFTSPTTGSVTPPTSSISTGSVSTASRATGSTSPTTGSVTPPTSSVSIGSVSPNSRATGSTSPTTGSITPHTSSIATGSVSTTSRETGSTSPTTGSATPPTSTVSTGSVTTASRGTDSTSPTTGSATPPTSSSSTGSVSTASSATGSTSPTTGSATPPTSSVSTASVSTASRDTGSTSPTTGSITTPTLSVSTGSESTISKDTDSTSPTTGSVTPPTVTASTGSVSTASRVTDSTSPTTGSITPPTLSISTASASTASRNTGSTSPTTGSVTPPTFSVGTGSVSTASRGTGSTSPTTGSITPPTSSVSTSSVSTVSTITDHSTSPTTGSVTPPTSSTASTLVPVTGQSTSSTTGSVTPPTSSFSTVSSTSGTTSSSASTSPSKPSSSVSSGTTSTEIPPFARTCLNPGVPENTVVVYGSNTEDIKTGQIYGYKCIDGYSLAEGDLIRACLKSGFLTGHPPVCKDSASVLEPVNNVNIRRREWSATGGFAYFGLNKDSVVEKNGKISSWRFYSNINGSIALQVWRPTAEKRRFILVGQNTIAATLTDRVRTIEIAEAEQILVEVGDVLGIFFPDSDYGHVPYTLCAMNYQPEQSNQYVSKRQKTSTSDWNVGDVYVFKGDTDRCKIWSLNAFI